MWFYEKMSNFITFYQRAVTENTYCHLILNLPQKTLDNTLGQLGFSNSKMQKSGFFLTKQ